MAKLGVLVGCNYPNTQAQLHGCINDVLRMRHCLINRFGFENHNIRILIDTDSTYTQPTGHNIRQALLHMVESSSPGDILFFHYSGHGTLIPAESGHPNDNGFDECIVPSDFNLLTDEDFRDIVNRVPEGASFTMVSDSCHSGGLIGREKEQIGATTTVGSRGNFAEEELASSLKNIVLEDIHNVLERKGYHVPFRHDHSHQLGSQREAHHSQIRHGKNKSLPIQTLLEILREKSGRYDIDVGKIRVTLFHLFGNEASPKVKRFMNVLLQRVNRREEYGGLLSFVGGVAMDYLKQILEETDDSSQYVKPALAVWTDDLTTAYAGTKIGVQADGIQDMGILLSGCGVNETSADANPTGHQGHAYGAFSNALQTVLAKHLPPITYRQLVLAARRLLKEEGFLQHPCLYCSDENVNAIFLGQSN